LTLPGVVQELETVMDAKKGEARGWPWPGQAVSEKHGVLRAFNGVNIQKTMEHHHFEL